MAGASPTIVLLVGPKGAGKSHLGALAEARLGAHFLRVEPIFLEVQRAWAAAGPARDAEGYRRVVEAAAAGVRLPWDLELDNGGPAPEAELLAGLRRVL